MPTPTPGRSTRIETPATMAARTQVGNAGMGLLGSEIAATGTHGPGYIYGALNLPADANFEISGEITRWPTNGVLTTFEDGSFTYSGTTDYFLWLLKVGGIPSTDNTLGYGAGISRVNLTLDSSVVVFNDTVQSYVAKVSINKDTDQTYTTFQVVLRESVQTYTAFMTGSTAVSSDCAQVYESIAYVSDIPTTGVRNPYGRGSGLTSRTYGGRNQIHSTNRRHTY